MVQSKGYDYSHLLGLCACSDAFFGKLDEYAVVAKEYELTSCFVADFDYCFQKGEVSEPKLFALQEFERAAGSFLVEVGQ